MKKLFLLIFLITFVFSTHAFAEEADLIIPAESITPTPTIAPTNVNYSLPYPGILPGSPLYFLKAIRDRIVEMLISDPLKKSNYYLLQADKRLAASIALFEKGDRERAEITISKGQNYLEKSLDKALDAKAAKQDIGEILSRIKTSSAKQKEEIKVLIEKSDGQIKDKLENNYKRAGELYDRANQIRS